MGKEVMLGRRVDKAHAHNAVELHRRRRQLLGVILPNTQQCEHLTM
jgi:hypothetical protein